MFVSYLQGIAVDLERYSHPVVMTVDEQVIMIPAIFFTLNLTFSVKEHSALLIFPIAFVT